MSECPPSDAVARLWPNARSRRGGLLVKDLGSAALAWAAMPSFAVVAGGDLALPWQARLYERRAFRRLRQPSAGRGPIARAGSSSLKLWAYVHGRLNRFTAARVRRVRSILETGAPVRAGAVRAGIFAETPRSELADAIPELKTWPPQAAEAATVRWGRSLGDQRRWHGARLGWCHRYTAPRWIG